MPFLGTTPTQGFVGANPKQSFTADGSTTVFTLTNPVASANDLEVFVGNVRQEPTAAYSAAGTTLTMTEAPDTGLNFYVINKSQAQVTTTPPDGSVGTAKLAATAVTTAKIASSAITDAKIATGITASKLTGALPAISGASLTGAGGMQLLLDTSFGGYVGAGSVTSYDISSTYINATYDDYYLTFSARPSSDNKYLQMQVFVAGSIVTSSHYCSELHNIGSTGNQSGSNADANISLTQFGTGNDVGAAITASLHIQNVNSTLVPFGVSGFTNSYNTDPVHNGTVVSGGLIHAQYATVVNGIRFKMHSGNIYGGHVRLYGLRT